MTRWAEESLAAASRLYAGVHTFRACSSRKHLEQPDRPTKYTTYFKNSGFRALEARDKGSAIDAGTDEYFAAFFAPSTTPYPHGRLADGYYAKALSLPVKIHSVPETGSWYQATEDVFGPQQAHRNGTGPLVNMGWRCALADSGDAGRIQLEKGHAQSIINDYKDFASQTAPTQDVTTTPFVYEGCKGIRSTPTCVWNQETGTQNNCSGISTEDACGVEPWCTWRASHKDVCKDAKELGNATCTKHQSQSNGIHDPVTKEACRSAAIADGAAFYGMQSDGGETAKCTLFSVDPKLPSNYEPHCSGMMSESIALGVWWAMALYRTESKVAPTVEAPVASAPYDKTYIHRVEEIGRCPPANTPANVHSVAVNGVLANGGDDVVRIGAGTKAWADEAFAVTSMPHYLKGGHLARLPQKGILRGSKVSFDVSAGGKSIYVATVHDETSRHGGLDKSLAREGWSATAHRRQAHYHWHTKQYDELLDYQLKTAARVRGPVASTPGGGATGLPRAEAGCVWQLIMAQDAKMDGMFPAAAKDTLNLNEDDPSATAYSTVGSIQSDEASLVGVAGAYEFAMVYFFDDWKKPLHWLQTSWLAERVKPTGFVGISPTDIRKRTGTDKEFTGLANGDRNALLDGNGVGQDYWNAAGAIKDTWDKRKIRAWDGLLANSMKLYVKRNATLWAAERALSSRFGNVSLNLNAVYKLERPPNSGAATITLPATTTDETVMAIVVVDQGPPNMWEMEVPNGLYRVEVTLGRSATRSHYHSWGCAVENTRFYGEWHGYKHNVVSAMVEVSDGRLSLGATSNDLPHRDCGAIAWIKAKRVADRVAKPWLPLRGLRVAPLGDTLPASDAAPGTWWQTEIPEAALIGLVSVSFPSRYEEWSMIGRVGQESDDIPWDCRAWWLFRGHGCSTASPFGRFEGAGVSTGVVITISDTPCSGAECPAGGQKVCRSRDNARGLTPENVSIDYVKTNDRKGHRGLKASHVDCGGRSGKYLRVWLPGEGRIFDASVSINRVMTPADAASAVGTNGTAAYVCYGVSARKHVDSSTPEYIITNDPLDSIFYSTCYVRERAVVFEPAPGSSGALAGESFSEAEENATAADGATVVFSSALRAAGAGRLMHPWDFNGQCTWPGLPFLYPLFWNGPMFSVQLQLAAPMLVACWCCRTRVNIQRIHL